MRTNNSRDKYSKQPTMETTQTRMLKTSTSTRTKPQQPPNNRPASGKKIQSTTIIPEKIVKKDYVVAQNMTESRIYEAKQGLQLLKKKMSTKGMSRQKVSSMNRIPEEKPSLKTISSQKTQSKFQNLNSNIPPRKTEKKISEYEEPPKKTTPKIPMKKASNIQTTKIQLKQQPPSRNYEQYNSPEEEAPISQKKDFNALLEEELRKQAKKQQKQVQNYQSYDEDPGEVQLVQCGQGCGRMFSVQAIDKHEKICQKVFQSKRKAFDSAAHRAPENEGFDKGGMKSTGMPKKAREEKKPVKQQNKGNIPKWKAESLAFRASLKSAQGKPISQQEKQAAQIGMVQCKFCGRKFNETAAARHIPFCETKSKQLPRKKK